MPLNTTDFVDQLSENEARELLKIQLERNKLLVKQCNILLFNYDVAQNVMRMHYLQPDGTTKIASFERYLQETPNVLFDFEEHRYVAEQIRNVLEHKDTPETGAINFNYKNGIRMSCDYTCCHNKEGKIASVVGHLTQLNQRLLNQTSARKSVSEMGRLTESLLAAYDTILQINLKDYSFKLIHATQAVMAASQKVKNVLELGALFRDYYIAPDYHKAFNEFIDPKTLADRIYGCKSISCEYMTSNIGWSHARIVPTEIDSHGRVTQAILTTESCNAAPANITNLGTESVKDGLTGLFSLTMGKKMIGEELEKKQEALFFLFDCDYFRAINSMLGQAIGDIVLLETSKELCHFFPQSTLMRAGGDEFIAYTTNPTLLAEAKEKGIESIYTRLTEEMKEVQFPEMNGVLQSVSAGIVKLGANQHYDFDTIFNQAHEALKEAKKMGGGHCVIHNS